MSKRINPSRAVLKRGAHRKWLTRHFMVLAAGLTTAFVVNRFLSPNHFWAHWVALGWGAVFAGHLAVFSKETLATMGSRR